MQNEPKPYNATLVKNQNDQYIIRIDIDGKKYDLNFAENDINKIRELFMVLIKEAVKQPIQIQFDKDKVATGTSDYYKNAADDYIKQLNSELRTLENNDDLKEIRKMNSEENGTNC